MTDLVPPNRFTDVEGSSPDDPAIGSRSQSQEIVPSATNPYETRLNILHGPLEVIDINALAAASDHKWFNHYPYGRKRGHHSYRQLKQDQITTQEARITCCAADPCPLATVN